MINAKYFTYNGTSSEQYKLQIGDFDDSSVVETNLLTRSLLLQKAARSEYFYCAGVEYDEPPSYQFAVVRQEEIDGATRRSILNWLLGPDKYQELHFIEGDDEGYTYYGVFTSVSTIYVHGRCHGFRLSVQFNSPYAIGFDPPIEVDSGTTTVTVENNSDDADGYVYPTVTFSGACLDIVNTTDDPDRHFTFSGMSGTTIVDNKARHIKNTDGIMPLSGFTSHNWLRLRKGSNTLTITSDSPVTITRPKYLRIAS